MISAHDILLHPVGNRDDMSGAVHIQPPAESGVGDFMKGMIFRIMGGL